MWTSPTPQPVGPRLADYEVGASHQSLARRLLRLLTCCRSEVPIFARTNSVDEARDTLQYARIALCPSQPLLNSSPCPRRDDALRLRQTSSHVDEEVDELEGDEALYSTSSPVASDLGPALTRLTSDIPPALASDDSVGLASTEPLIAYREKSKCCFRCYPVCRQSLT